MKSQLFIYKQSYIIFMVYVFVGFCGIKASAQEVPDISSIPKSWWFSVNGGATTVGALGGGGSISAEIANRWLLTANAESEAAGIINNNNGVISYNLLIGKLFKQHFSFFSASAGLGLVDDYNNTDQSTGFFTYKVISNNDRYTINIPIIIQEYLVIGQTVGFGIGAYANINPIRSTAGINLNFALGRLSTHKHKN